ncbi:DUF4031 domain-containing protein [Streptomyces parvulus]
MTVYVDGITDYGDVAKRNGLRTTLWAHLVADTVEELHTFAARIGLRRTWFQNADNYRWHYDVTPAKRAAAVAAGAVEIDRRKLTEIMAQRRAAQQPAPGGGWTDGELVTVTGVVTDTEHRTTGQGAPWAVAAVDGPTPVEAHIFPAVYPQVSALLAIGSRLVFTGRVDTRVAPPLLAVMSVTPPPAAASLPVSVVSGEPKPPSPVFGHAGGWSVVMQRAGECCQCTGQCGATHRKSAGRCDARHGAYGGKGHPPIRLEVAPEDPTIPEYAAARMTPDQLMAWCAGCRSGAVKKAKPPQGKKVPAQVESLFDASELG